MRILYNTSLLTESLAFSKSTNTDVLTQCAFIYTPVSDERRVTDQ